VVRHGSSDRRDSDLHARCADGDAASSEQQHHVLGQLHSAAQRQRNRDHHGGQQRERCERSNDVSSATPRRARLPLQRFP
jgi:hypothetical protein